MKSLVAGALAIALAGCAISHETYAPDGRRAYSIDCPGAALSWGSCYEKAGSLCKGAGYDVLAGGSEGGAVIGGGPSGFFGGTTMHRNMLIACRSSG
jgi:hypothetical protein